MKSINTERLALLIMLLNCFCFNALSSICWNEIDSLCFEPQSAFVSERLDFKDVRSSEKISMGIPLGFSFNGVSDMNAGNYCIVANPSIVNANYINETSVSGGIFMVTKLNDNLPFIKFENLSTDVEYTISFDMVNTVSVSGSSCNSDWGNKFGIKTHLVNPQNNLPFDGIIDEDTKWTELSNGETKTLTFTFRSATLTAVNIVFSDFGNFRECTTLGLKNIRISGTKCMVLRSTQTVVCKGKKITLSPDKYVGTSTSFEWYRKQEGESNFMLYKTTDQPSLQDIPQRNTSYFLKVNGDSSNVINIEVGDKCLYITPHYSSDLCVEDTNTLIASGYIVLDHLDSSDYLWEEYDEETSSWKTLDSKTTKQKIKPTKTTKYRVSIAGETVEYEHKIAPCHSLVCDLLDSKVVFLETFGFFMDSVTYVDTKDVIHQNVINTVSSGNLQIQKYWAPDPYDYIVYPTEFSPVINSYDDKVVVYDGDTVKNGTNGHQYALLDPRNPDPTSTSQIRRNGGYTWCNNQDYMNGNYRIEDGFYALVRDPVEADCGNGDFWQGSDHTGNHNGAMLMVNCGPTKATIYSQKLDVGCSNLNLNFSAYISNAISYKKDKAMTPVNITFRILNKEGNLIESQNSEDIICHDSLTWIQQTMQFESGNDTEFYVQLLNNGASGYGNDILLDDVSFSICLPKVVLVTEGMDIDNPEVVRVCNDTTIRLFAKQKKEILEHPLYKFQYKDSNEVWQDINPNQTDFTSSTTDVESSDPRFWGDVEFRVIVAESVEVLNKVSKDERLNPCDIYTMANSTLTIINAYGGPMSSDQTVEVCKGETVVMTGSRVYESIPNWDHKWMWEWRDEAGNVISGYEKSADPSKKTLSVFVSNTNAKYYFYAYDEDCELRQLFQLKGKNASGLDVKNTLWEGCDSLKMYPNVVSSTSVLKWMIDGDDVNYLLGDTIVIKPQTLPASGFVSVETDSTSSVFCPVDPIKIPYKINAGESLSVSLSAGDANHLCLDPEKYDTVALLATVTPAASTPDVKFYLWSVNEMPLDTTTTNQLIISTDPNNKYYGLLKSGVRLKFEVRVADGLCFTVDEPSDPGSLYLEVNETYRVDLVAHPNDSLCLTDLKSDTVTVLKAIASAISNPDNHDVQNNIKKYIWRVNGVKFAETTTPEYVVLISNHPEELTEYLQAGTSPVFTVAAVDSICFQSEGESPKGEIKVVFNESYSMKINPDSKVVCVPEELPLGEDQILLSLVVSTDPAAAQNHIQEYMWYIDGMFFRSTIAGELILRHSDLFDKIGTSPNITVKSYDGICSDKNNPAENSNEVTVDIRSGGYSLKLDVLSDVLCIDTLHPENNQIKLSATVKPANAGNMIDKYYWMESGVVIDSSSVSDFTVTQAQFPNIIKAGKTAVFNVQTYDSVCVNGFVTGIGEGENVYVNESYKIELEADDDSACYDDGNSAKLLLTAKVFPSDAANHIKWYRWYKNGILLDSTEIGNIEINNIKYPGALVSGENPTFSVDSYDGICYSGENPSEQARKVIVISFRYKLELDHAGKDSICLGSDSIVLRAVVTPKESKANISTYIWEMIEGGVTKVFETTYAPEDSVVISKYNYPDLFTAGMSLKFRVKSVDGICYTKENPNVSEDVNIEMNDNYSMQLVSSSDTICYSDDVDASLTLTAIVDPAKAANHIKWYRWYKDGVLLDSTEAPTINISNSKYPGALQAGNEPVFKVDSYDGFCYTVQDPSQSDGVEVVINRAYTMDLNMSATYLCLGSDSIVMTAVVTPQESAGSIKEYYWKVNGKLFETTQSPINFVVLSYANYPDLLNSIIGTTPEFSVESVDGICYTVDNPATSESVTIAVGGSYDIALEVPSDSICFEDEASVTLKLKANVSPEDSKGLIKWYRWYKNGALIDSTSDDYIVLDNVKYPGILVAGGNPTFSVDSYDDVCYTSEDPARSGDVTIIMNERFSIILNSDGKDYLCSGSDSIRLTAVVDPEGSKMNISRYYWTMDDIAFDTTTVDHIILCRDNYPTLFVAGSTPRFGVKAVDGICYTDKDPAVSEDVLIRINELFDVKIKPNEDKICASGDNSTLNLSAIVTPSGSMSMIEEYRWYMIKNEVNEKIYIGKSSKPDTSVSEIAPGEYSFYLEAIDGICFSVNPAISDSVNISVHENIFVNLTADKLKYCMESSNQTPSQIEITANVTQGTPNKYEVYDGNGLLFNMQTSQKVISFTVVPTLANHKYSVKVYDGVCNNNEATAATNGNPLDIAVFDPIKIGVKADKENICLGDTVYLSLDLTQGSPVQYTWYGTTYDGTDITLKTNRADTLIADVPVASGYRNYVVIASDGICDDAIVSYGSVFVKDKIKVNLLSDKETVVIGGSINLYADVLSGEPISYVWKIGDNVIATTGENVLLEYPKSPSTYTVEATDSVCSRMEASLNISVQLPTAFTPIGIDGLNDHFMKGFQVSIFNRYGQLVYAGDDGWSGMSYGAMADPGVYFYSVVLKDGKTIKGTIELVKLN